MTVPRKGDMVKAKGRKGWLTLHQRAGNGNGWWAWQHGRFFVPVKDEDITKVRMP